VVLSQDLQAVILLDSKTHIAVDIRVGYTESPRKNEHNLGIFAAKINKAARLRFSPYERHFGSFIYATCSIEHVCRYACVRPERLLE
jgi:hypothetical protein